MSGGISNFNPQTGLAYNNPEYPRIGDYSCNTCGGGHDCPCCADFTGVVSRDGDCSTDLPVLFTNSVKYTPPTAAGGLIDILPATTADMVATPGTTGEQFLSGPNGLQLRTTNTPATVASDCVLTYKSATTNYAWEQNTSVPSIPIGGIIMGYTPITAAMFPITEGGATWALCDGVTPGTPDLRNKFVKVAYASGAIIPVMGTVGGSTGITLVQNQLPNHTHDSPAILNTPSPGVGNGNAAFLYSRDALPNPPGNPIIPGIPFIPTGTGSAPMDRVDTTGTITSATTPPNPITIDPLWYALFYMMRIA